MEISIRDLLLIIGVDVPIIMCLNEIECVWGGGGKYALCGI